MEELLEKIERKESSHKGENGRVGVIAGSRDYTGAPALSAKAALRTGADLTKILTSEPIRNTVAGYSENFIVGSYRSDYFDYDSMEKARELESWGDAIVIGPGMSDAEDGAIENFVSLASKPLVIDADAIKPALGSELGKAVFTPHEGEAEAIRQEFGSVEKFAGEKEVVVVVKGREDMIYTPDEVYENSTGHEAMTAGGTGDVLTGVIASLAAQGLGLEEAARLGAWINGKAGEKAAEKYGNGALATDIAEELARID